MQDAMRSTFRAKPHFRKQRSYVCIMFFAKYIHFFVLPCVKIKRKNLQIIDQTDSIWLFQLMQITDDVNQETFIYLVLHVFDIKIKFYFGFKTIFFREEFHVLIKNTKCTTLLISSRYILKYLNCIWTRDKMLFQSRSKIFLR